MAQSATSVAMRDTGHPLMKISFDPISLSTSRLMVSKSRTTITRRRTEVKADTRITRYVISEPTGIVTPITLMVILVAIILTMDPHLAVITAAQYPLSTQATAVAHVRDTTFSRIRMLLSMESRYTVRAPIRAVIADTGLLVVGWEKGVMVSQDIISKAIT